MEVTTMTTNYRTYLEVLQYETYEERFNYLKLNGKVGKETFGSNRVLNQILYKDPEWRRTRDKIILRDKGCDLGIPGREIFGPISVHHINPITVEDVINRTPNVFDQNNLICTSDLTHRAIHYSDDNILLKDPIVRTRNDTCPWKN